MDAARKQTILSSMAKGQAITTGQVTVSNGNGTDREGWPKESRQGTYSLAGVSGLQGYEISSLLREGLIRSELIGDENRPNLEYRLTNAGRAAV